MTEWKLFDGDVPHVSTAEFHADRERAPHLEQEDHKGRLTVAARMIREAAGPLGTFSDLGCGDGGLLSLVQGSFHVAWGYDFQPSNAAGWHERGVDAAYLDVFGGDRDKVLLGSVVAMTEVLEHLADPHGTLEWLYAANSADTLVCSSPWNEGPQAHDPCHAWAWDYSGYEAMIVNAGWRIREHVMTGRFQVVRAEK